MSGRTLVRGDGTPLWQQLLADLRRRLEDGEFDAALPGEFALAAEYGVSRYTVREALRRMREDGAVVAGRGRVARPAGPGGRAGDIEQPLDEPYSLYVAVEAAGRTQRSVVRTFEVRADGVIATRMGLEESTPLVHLERLRLADGEPLAVDRVWLPEAVAAPLLDVDFTHTGLYPEYRRRCGIRVDGGDENIRAVIPGRGEQELLGIGADVAVLSIERLGLSGDRPVEWRHTLVRGDRFSVTARFSAHAGYRVDLAESGTDTPTPPRVSTP
ncbi:transcriptional regulator, GntR family [Pseudonocardia ammonioxydans]|uniref:Transcriptional regulator, GntR family n=1 Tax=Pseudonocardia ammonioxydans TaxID=260086 RepID=A0A1I4S162_PSUAM|nr:GntR family transcriptional regulator [Pseudonocardia ammonioxydans]SFM58205.1 transcriptional regulator, GntR family [Pseudonocardia ammonioxydans]